MYTVILSPDAFRLIVSSALEAYAVPHGANHNPGKHIPLETCGAIWGYETESENNKYFHVVAVDVDTSAHRKPDCVASKLPSIEVKKGFYERYNPELKYLGDFHSHPWSQGEKVEGYGYELKTAQNIEQHRLYRFSGSPKDISGDFESVAWLKKQKLSYQIGLVTTIYRMRNVVNDPLHSFLDEKSAFRFTYNGKDASGNLKSFRCWVKAYVFPKNSCEPAPNTEVKLQCSALGFLP
jgi:hypothetical protein